MNDDIIDAAKMHFASNYFEARQKFRDYVGQARLATFQIYLCPARGPRGEDSRQTLPSLEPTRLNVGVMISRRMALEALRMRCPAKLTRRRMPMS